MILSALLLIVGPLVLGVATAWLLVRVVPPRGLLRAAAGIALLGFALHILLAVSEVTERPTDHHIAAGQRYVLAVLIGTLFFSAVCHLGHRTRPGPPVEDAELDRCERARLASSLHDTVGQRLAVIMMQLRGVERAPDPQGRLGIIDSTARETMDEVRRLITDLRRPGATIRETGARTDVTAVLNSFRAAGTAVRFLIRGRESDIPEELHAVVVRVLREALTNAMKHAAGDSVSVELTVTGRIVLRVRSGLGGNGTGVLTEDCWRGGDGMRGLAELVGRHGGMLRFGPDPEGFEVLVVMPLAGAGSAVRTAVPVGLELVG